MVFDNNRCIVGSYNDIADTDTQWLWECQGDGGDVVTCQADVTDYSIVRTMPNACNNATSSNSYSTLYGTAGDEVVVRSVFGGYVTIANGYSESLSESGFIARPTGSPTPIFDQAYTQQIISSPPGFSFSQDLTFTMPANGEVSLQTTNVIHNHGNGTQANASLRVVSINGVDAFIDSTMVCRGNSGGG